MSDRPRRKVRLRLVLLIGALATMMVFVAIRRDRVYKPGQTIQYDDFAFTVRGVNRSPVTVTKKDGQQTAMVEYVVKLMIDNKAKRVSFPFAYGSVALFDVRYDRRYLVDLVAQRAYDEATGEKRPDPMVLKAGESATRAYVFRLPADVPEPRLRIAPGGWSGFMIQKLLFGIKEFQLP